ncbi:MAG TPA: hypothetical protein PLD23_06005, partial [Armatimonadota bacterium]|nr:hypothetical protein [Armatimonadota bacterium]
THYWPDDKAECDREGVLWIPVVYPGFSWDNLMQKPPGTTRIPRRKGQFLWEQFLRLRELGVDTAYVAMFDEVDEGTAIFKVTSAPPVEGHFVGYEGLASDAYLQVVREGIALLRGQREPVAEAPVGP